MSRHSWPCWVHEELWHGEAIGKVLAAHGEPTGSERLAPLRRRLARRNPLSMMGHLARSALASESFVALHMSWGALNEWTTQAGYGRLGSLERHPVLTELLRRVMRQEGRHIDYYASEAHRRLDADPRA